MTAAAYKAPLVLAAAFWHCTSILHRPRYSVVEREMVADETSKVGSPWGIRDPPLSLIDRNDCRSEGLIPTIVSKERRKKNTSLNKSRLVDAFSCCCCFGRRCSISEVTAEKFHVVCWTPVPVSLNGCVYFVYRILHFPRHARPIFSLSPSHLMVTYRSPPIIRNAGNTLYKYRSNLIPFIHCKFFWHEEAIPC